MGTSILRRAPICKSEVNESIWVNEVFSFQMGLHHTLIFNQHTGKCSTWSIKVSIVLDKTAIKIFPPYLQKQ